MKKIILLLLVSMLTAPAFAEFPPHCLDELKTKTVDGILELNKCQLYDEDMRPVASFVHQHPEIVGVDISSNYITWKGVKTLLMNNSIKSLYAYGVSLEDLELVELANIIKQQNRMESVAVQYKGSEGPKALASVPSLREIHLSPQSSMGGELNDDAIMALAKKPNLQTLSLGFFYKLTHAELTQLVKNPSLTTLSLFFSGIDDEEAEILATSKTLAALYLASNHITSVGAKALAKSTTLKSLDLTFAEIDDEAVSALAANSSFEELDLSECKVSDTAVATFANNTTLKHLILKYNNITDAGVIALAKNKSIEELSLYQNNIGDAGAIALAANSMLRFIELQYNHINKPGLDALESMNNVVILLEGNDGVIKHDPDYVSKKTHRNWSHELKHLH